MYSIMGRFRWRSFRTITWSRRSPRQPDVWQPERPLLIYVRSACNDAKRPVLTAGTRVAKYAHAHDPDLILTGSERNSGLPGSICASEEEALEQRASMGRGKRYEPEQVVNLLRQIEVAIANGKATEQDCGSQPKQRPGLKFASSLKTSFILGNAEREVRDLSSCSSTKRSRKR